MPNTCVWGVNDKRTGLSGSSYAALGSALLTEEQSSGTNGSGVGLGQRLAAHTYKTSATSVMPSSGYEKDYFDGGRQLLLSFSGGYGWTNTDADNMFNRLYGLDFGGTDTSGTGTKKPNDIWLVRNHEMDAKGKPSPATFIDDWKRLRARKDLRATALGVDPQRVKMVWLCIAYGVQVGRVEVFWPGNDQVDLFGFDVYNFDVVAGRKPWIDITGGFNASVAFSKAHGDKSIVIGELQTTEDVNDPNRSTLWWNQAAKLIAAEPKIIGVFPWVDNGWAKGTWEKSVHPLKHEAMRQAMFTVGGYAGFGASGSTTQLKPTIPKGATFTSAADGKSITVTWSANPTADNVTGWDVFLAPGAVTSGFKGQNSTTLPASPRSYVITGLTPGAPYSVTTVAINSAGRSGFGNMYSASTTLPGPTNQSPSITSALVTIDTTDPSLAHFDATATDPNSDPLTFVWTISGPKAFTDTKTGASTSGSYTPGAYSVQLAVSDGLLVTTKAISFNIADGPTATPSSNYEIPQPGISLPEITRIYRATIPDIDYRLSNAETARSPHNALQGFVASTFDPVLASATKTAAATGDLRWYTLLLQSNGFVGIHTYITDAQVGTGTVLCVHDADGNQLCDPLSGSAVDTALQSVGTTNIDLPQPVVGLPPGSTVYVSILHGAATPFKTYVAGGQSVLGTANVTVGHARGNILASQSSYPDVLPFNSASAVTSAWFALY